MEITYLNHSGFSVETEEYFLLFDYTGEGLPLPTGGRKIYAFVSHAHDDHYGTWVKAQNMTLIGGFDVTGADISLSPGECYIKDTLRVTACPSTDEGVSFFVELGGSVLFHAGDLNFWHWKDESTEAEIQAAEALFEAALEQIPKTPIGIAFFPVDPRMGTDYDAGARRFIEAFRPKILIPMHFWDKSEAAMHFANLPMPGGVTVRAMTKTGEKFIIN